MTRLRRLLLSAPAVLVSMSAVISASPACAQGRAADRSSMPALGIKTAMSFPPFNEWKAAVLSGNEGALMKLYSTNPPVQVLIGKDVITDPAEEAQFWSGFGHSGLINFNPKILAISHPQSDTTELVLRVEAKIRQAGASKDAGTAGIQDMVASVGQLWKQESDGWRIVSTQRGNFVVNAPFRLPQPAKPDTQLYPKPADAQKDLDTALMAAKIHHKRVLVVFGANWCYDCHVLNSTFTSLEFAPLVKANYVVVHVNIGDEGKDNLDLGKRLGVGLERGIPSLAVLDPDGKVVYAQRNGEFESARKIGPTDVRDFLERWKPNTSRSSGS
jgi:thiol-disulfide isomerase/thioredoxin